MTDIPDHIRRRMDGRGDWEVPDEPTEKHMKRIVTITIEGDVPDTVNFSREVADILERHAHDIRDRDHLAGQTARGGVSIEQDGGEYLITWLAAYDVLGMTRK